MALCCDRFYSSIALDLKPTSLDDTALCMEPCGVVLATSHPAEDLLGYITTHTYIYIYYTSNILFGSTRQTILKLVDSM